LSEYDKESHTIKPLGPRSHTNFFSDVKNCGHTQYYHWAKTENFFCGYTGNSQLFFTPPALLPHDLPSLPALLLETTLLCLLAPQDQQ